jgi:hypothetical protein
LDHLVVVYPFRVGCSWSWPMDGAFEPPVVLLALALAMCRVSALVPGMWSGQSWDS